MKVRTIKQVTEAILNAEVGDKTDLRRVANEAYIYGNAFLIAENGDIDSAMKYFYGTHSDSEYKELITEEKTK